MLKVNERAELIKKAVMAGVGATTNIERVKSALSEAFEDLTKVGQDLIDDLQESGKGKTEQVQAFLQNLQEEASRRSSELGKNASVSTKKMVKELGLATHNDIQEVLERLHSIESLLSGTSGSEGPQTQARILAIAAKSGVLKKSTYGTSGDFFNTPDFAAE